MLSSGMLGNKLIIVLNLNTPDFRHCSQVGMLVRFKNRQPNWSDYLGLNWYVRLKMYGRYKHVNEMAFVINNQVNISI